MNQTTCHPSFLENILGSHYKWWFFLRTSFVSATMYRTTTILYMIGRMGILGFTILIWYLNIKAGSNLVDFNTIFTYYIVGSILTWKSGLNWNFAGSITSGRVSSQLLLPQPIFVLRMIGDFGWWVYSNIFETGLLLLISVLGREYITLPSWPNLILFIILSINAYFIKAWIQIITGCLAFYLTEVGGVMNILNDIDFYLSGRAVPLNLVGFLLPLTFLPFAFFYYYPVQVFMGGFSSIQLLAITFGSLIWNLIMYFCAQWSFRRGLKRYESVGL